MGARCTLLLSADGSTHTTSPLSPSRPPCGRLPRVACCPRRRMNTNRGCKCQSEWSMATQVRWGSNVQCVPPICGTPASGWMRRSNMLWQCPSTELKRRCSGKRMLLTTAAAPQRHVCQVWKQRTAGRTSSFPVDHAWPRNIRAPLAPLLPYWEARRIGRPQGQSRCECRCSWESGKYFNPRLDQLILVSDRMDTNLPKANCKDPGSMPRASDVRPPHQHVNGACTYCRLARLSTRPSSVLTL